MSIIYIMQIDDTRRTDMVLINLNNKKTVAAYENVLIKYDIPSESIAVYSEQGELVGNVNPYDHRFNVSDIEKLRGGVQYTIIRQKSGHAFAQESDTCPESLFTVGLESPPAVHARRASLDLTYADCINNAPRIYDNIRYNLDMTTRCKSSDGAMTIEWVSKNDAPASKMSYQQSVSYLKSALHEIRKSRDN